ncbi:glycosyltransferase family 4 protein [Streptomyces sp. SCSIO 30461]|uniref:glycosyltransferase family 4 protein n=1 Tax=Streptomyces sp. SCSIO 30461 TaxID=3118085 RepID=UPI0030D2C75D
MKVSFLIHTIYGIGGTIRTTLNLAEELAGRHEVEIVSVFRHRDEPLFAIDPRISVVPLIDTRSKSPTNEKKHPLALQPAEHFPLHEARFKEYSKLSDERVRDHYATSDADVVVGTRPGLVAYASRFAPERAVLIGQEHMTHNHHKAELRAEMREHLAALDAFVTVSEGDAAVWRERMPLPDTRILAIPNSVPEPPVPPSDGTGRTIVAAGRLAGEKQYDVLIEAFGKVVAERPDWELRIYGWGNQGDKLRRLADRLGLYNCVHFMGPHSPIEPEWAKGAIAASTSRHESFGMTLVEAMRCGLPVVSTDCDYGPREILQDGTDGLLVPVGDVEAVAKALVLLIDDEELRRSMGAAAMRNARRFSPERVAERYEELFAELRVRADERTGARARVGTRVGTGDATRAGADDTSAPAAVTGARAVPAVPERGAFGAEKAPRTPVVDCTAGADGTLRFSTAPGSPEVSRLLCVNAAGEERVYPFADDGTATVGAAGEEEFAEGVWECFAELPHTAGPVRLRARALDLRAAMRAGERVGPVRHLLPYAGRNDKLLGFRAWLRPAHAEVDTVTVVGGAITLDGHMAGVAASEGAAGEPRLLLRRRGEPAELVFPGRSRGSGHFRFRFPLDDLVARLYEANEVWDLYVRYTPGSDPVKLAKVLDDVVAKAGVFTYPVSRLPKAGSSGLFARNVARAMRWMRRTSPKPVTVRVYYVAANDLAINVVDGQL